MNASIALEPQLLDAPCGTFAFRVLVTNTSRARLLFPEPEVTSLSFSRSGGDVVAEWYTHLLVHGRWRGFVLEPSASREVSFRLMACHEARMIPSEQRDRWCVGLEPGRYDVAFRWTIDESYHDGDTHCYFEDLRFKAASEGAELWVGTAVSNVVHVSYRHNLQREETARASP